MEKNKSFAEAVTLLNKIESERVEATFERILKTNSGDVSTLFSTKEKEKFMKILGIDERAFVNLINAIYFLSMQAAFDKNFKSIETQLRLNGLKEAHIESMQKAWTDNAGDFINKIKEKPVAIQRKLENITWTMNVPFQEGKLPVDEEYHFEEGDSENTSKNLYGIDIRNPQALINFSLSDGTENSEPENFVVRMNKSEMQEFFEHLEVIQGSMDGLFTS